MTRDKARRKDQTLEEDIDEALQSLYDDPYFKTKLVQGAKGIRRIYVGNKRPWRLIFCIVEECKQKGEDRKNGCNRQDPKAVIVWIVYPRKKNYKKIRERIGLRI